MPVNIKGKEYKTVAERINEFHANNKNCSIITEILKLDEKIALIKCTIYPDVSNKDRIFVGHSSEKIGSTMINTTSALENAETSAIGRALASAGYGGTEFASADEISNALANQTSATKHISQQSQISREKEISQNNSAETISIYDKIVKILMDKAHGITPQAEEMLEQISRFERDGKLYSIPTFELLKKKSPKWQMSIYGRLKEKQLDKKIEAENKENEEHEEIPF